jgi:hypothetical protein
MRTVDTTRIPPAGDPFSAKTPKPEEKRLRELEDRYQHDGSISEEERMELRDEIASLRLVKSGEG